MIKVKNTDNPEELYMTFSSFQSIPVNRWMNFTFMREGKLFKLYMNGELDTCVDIDY